MESTQTPTSSRVLDSARDNIRTTREITDQVTEAGRQLYMLHIEAAQQALTENTEQMRTFLQNTANLSNFLTQWSSLCQTQMQRHTELMRHSFDVAARTMTEINRMAGDAGSNATATSLAIAESAEQAGSDFIERRKTSQIINFPDRRQSGQSDQNRNAGGRTGSEKKRHAA
ncbi:MAG: phasin family protein [Betaproteobacteria bacterium]